MRDVMCNGYVAGANTRFFGEPDSGTGFTAPVTPDAVTDAMDKRLSFHDDASGEYQSMLAFGAPIGDGVKRDQVISITDRLLPWEITSPNTKNIKEYFPGGDAAYKSYRDVWNLNSIHFGEDVRAAENMEFVSQRHGHIQSQRLDPQDHCAYSSCPLPFADQPRLNEQWLVFHRPAPQVQPHVGPVPPARSRTGALWTGVSPPTPQRPGGPVALTRRLLLCFAQRHSRRCEMEARGGGQSQGRARLDGVAGRCRSRPDVRAPPLGALSRVLCHDRCCGLVAVLVSVGRPCVLKYTHILSNTSSTSNTNALQL